MGQPRRIDPRADDLEAFRARLVERLERLHQAALDERIRAQALTEIAQELRTRSLRIRSCAWCGSISVHEGWYPPTVSQLVERLSTRQPSTHGICPVCFDQLAEGVPYPSASPAGEPADQPA